MTNPDVAGILRIPGRLCHTPTNLAAAYPHGGTAIGTVGRVALRPLDPTFPVLAEEWGGAPVDLIEGGPRWVLDAELREYHAASLAALFPCYTAGAQGGAILKFNAGGSVRAGFEVGTVISHVLCFSPDNPDDHPFLLVRRAVPAIQETAMLHLNGSASPSIAVRWYMTPNSSKDVFDYGLRRDLTL